MGIPSYFSFIIKNHGKIIRKLKKMHVHNLYLDTNSIIYDTLRNGRENLILNVCLKIEEYIQEIRPDHTILIAFDGIAPVAKLEQQRNRRYKSALEKKIKKKVIPNYCEEWNTSAITPGTEFMIDLNKNVRNYFKGKEKIYNVKKIIVSGSDEVGEGEHKILQYIRDEDHTDLTTVVYGLDADLIMLCLNHLNVAPKLYLFRETPEFLKSIRKELEPNETYILDIPRLAEAVVCEMRGSLQDYIFICFFLGNDFMPHFPSINIRTTGIHIMMNAYKKINSNLIENNEICWKNVRKLVELLANEEWDNLTREYRLRERWEKRVLPDETPEDLMDRYLKAPTQNREIEKAIEPQKSHWEHRYYKELFNVEIDEDIKKDICINYLEGLEWNMKYYVEGCIDWRWHYKYNYPPLLKDLLKYIPYFQTNMIAPNDHKPVTHIVQLSYVLPLSSLYLLPKNIYSALTTRRLKYYPENAGLCWAFCKYIWESHVELPPIILEDLEAFIYEVQNKK